MILETYIDAHYIERNLSAPVIPLVLAVKALYMESRSHQQSSNSSREEKTTKSGKLFCKLMDLNGKPLECLNVSRGAFGHCMTKNVSSHFDWK